MLDPNLTGRVVLVTGSAKGVGRELLLACARQGADVAVHYRSSEDAAREVAAAAREAGATATVVQGDVTDPADVDDLFAAVEGSLGGVDALVNNVGTFAPVHWEDVDYATWNQVLDTNFNATYLCTKRALPGMRDREWGRVVNVGYASGERAYVHPRNFVYFVAKTGVLMFTRMVAADTQDDGITVNAVSPYVVENSAKFPEDLPRGRPAAFEDVAQALLFFLDENSGYISGENVEVDGGWLPESI